MSVLSARPQLGRGQWNSSANRGSQHQSETSLEWPFRGNLTSLVRFGSRPRGRRATAFCPRTAAQGSFFLDSSLALSQPHCQVAFLRKTDMTHKFEDWRRSGALKGHFLSKG